MHTNTQQYQDLWNNCKDSLQATNLQTVKEQFMCACTNSDYLAKQFIRNPSLLTDLLNQDAFNRHYTKIDLTERLAARLKRVANQEALMRELRLFRHQQMCVLYWRMYNNMASLEQTCEHVSALADVCIIQALEWLHEQMLQSWQSPKQQLIVLGMGKLGGNELNVSSDIDLIFCYPQSAELKHGNRSKTAQQFFTLLGQQLIHVLNHTTSEGFVFRVDMRLRPYGDSGPLVMSYAALVEYYQDQGREWERFAFVKARVITGTEQQQQALYKLLTPFVYRKYIDFSVLESPRQMKRLINQELRRKNLTNNIKLGAGGIREVEFIAQTLQLIHGGKLTELRTQHIFKALEQLRTHSLLTTKEFQALDEGYRFLRQLEHHIQGYQDKQTQELPIDQAHKELLAVSLGFKHYAAFEQVLDQHMQNIHSIFSALFVDAEQEQEVQPESQKSAELIWLNLEQNPDVLQLSDMLKDIGLSETETIAQQLEAFKNSNAIKHMGPRGSRRLSQLMPMLLGELKHFDNQAVIFQRLLTLLEAVARRTAYIELLTENQQALSILISLCAKSARIAQQVVDYPYVLDELISPATLFKPPQIEGLADQLRQMLSRIPEQDPELVMDSLREFKQINLLRITAADITGSVDVKAVSRFLTALAQTIIEAISQIAWQELATKHGVPEQYAEDYYHLQGFIIVAYGKMGGHELGYSSDLDLVFIHDGISGKTDGDKPIDSAIFYQRLAQKIIHWLSLRTRTGVLYEVDMRLRPSGNSGLLVSTINAFEQYQQTEAWTWEHQALIRARAVFGDQAIVQKFHDIRQAVLMLEREPSQLAKDVLEMRNKICLQLKDKQLKGNRLKEPPGEVLFDLKLSKGGLTDVEFLCQYLVLANASQYPELRQSTNMANLLNQLAKLPAINDPRLGQLVDYYLELRALVHNNALQNLPASCQIKRLDQTKLALCQETFADYLNIS